MGNVVDLELIQDPSLLPGEVIFCRVFPARVGRQTCRDLCFTSIIDINAPGTVLVSRSQVFKETIHLPKCMENYRKMCNNRLNLSIDDALGISYFYIKIYPF